MTDAGDGTSPGTVLICCIKCAVIFIDFRIIPIIIKITKVYLFRTLRGRTVTRQRSCPQVNAG